MGEFQGGRKLRNLFVCTVASLVMGATIAPSSLVSVAAAAAPVVPEVQRNFALGAKTQQSSTAEPGTGDSWKAVDGYGDKVPSTTKRQINPWWQVDLGSSQYLTELKIWRLSSDNNDYWVFSSAQPFTSDDPAKVAADPNVTAMHFTSAPGTTQSIPVQALARYVRIQGKGVLSVNEVEALGPDGRENFAKFGKATQSSTGYEGSPSRAIDGSAAGRHRSASVSHTGLEKNAWWQLDLGVSRRLSEIRVWNRTDCCANRLGDFYVFASDQPFASSDPAVLAKDPKVKTTRITKQPNPVVSVPVDRTARYVRVQLAGTNYLSLSEVEVVGPKPRNYAPAGKATQSSTVYGGMAEYAQDNNRSGTYGDYSTSHTDRDKNAWWQVDLGSARALNEIRVWNRTNCCAERLSDFYVFASDQPFASSDPAVVAKDPKVTTTRIKSQPNPVVSVPLNRTARYVRVQQAGSEYLTLAEVEVLGPDVVALPDSQGWIKTHDFGMFIHYGMATATNAQWADPKSPPSAFNPPQNVDPGNWVRAAKSAGMDYAVLTSKHHDGFALWPTKYSDYSIAASPYQGGKGDIVRDYVKAARDGGLKPGLYFSIWDTHNGESPQFIKNQLRELLTSYGEIDYLWFDGLGWLIPETKIPWNDLRDFIQQVSPNTIVGNNDKRWQLNSSDILLDEYRPAVWDPSRPPRDTNLPIEVAQPIDLTTWFYTTQSQAKEPLSADAIAKNQAIMAPRNVSYLVNVGPRLDGTFDQRYIDVLRQVGAR